LKEIYLGARADLRRAMLTASDLVSKHGVCGYKYIIQQVRFDNVYVSEKTLYETENKVEEMLNEADKKASKVINDNKEKFNKIVDLLMTKQVLSREELLEIRDAS
jgi:ATP-dependent Zn protease